MNGSFFADSGLCDHAILRPLSHIVGNWELTWDQKLNKYVEEEDSCAALLNELMAELEQTVPPLRYHDSEDRLAENVKKHLGWKIHKEGNRWVGEDYGFIIEQGGFDDFAQSELILAAAGRIHAARIRGQRSFDQMEESHRRMLASVMVAILYHRIESH
jgi:hypothetical protein